MFERTLYVKYISEKNNFIYLPFGLKFLKTGTCLRLSYNEQQNFYTSVHSIVPYLDDESIGLNALLAQALGIGENESVILHELSQLPSITSITIYTSFKEEYEVIEILSENIQETLLNQIRVLDSRQKFIIWIGQYIEILVNVDGVEPVSPGAIDFLTEVHIKLLNDDTQKTPLDTSINTKNINIKVSEGLAKYFNGGELYGQDKTLALKYFENKLGLVYRLVPLKALPLSTEITGCLKPFDVFITKEEITEYQLKESVSGKKSIYSVTNIFSGVYPEVTEKTIYVNLLPLENILKHHTLNLSQTLFVDDQVLNFFKYGLGHKVILKQIANPSHVSEIIICTKKNDSTDIIEEFKKYLAQGSDEVFLLNAHVPMTIGDNIVCSLKFFPPEGYCLVDDYLVRNCKYLIEYDDVKIIQYKTREEIVKNDLKFYENISNYKNIVDDVFHTFTSIGNGSFENVLITGKPGTGKTSLLKHICLRIQKYPYYFHVKMIECKSLDGKTMGTMMTHLNSIFSELVLRQPSILFLDDIHELCGCTQSSDTTLKDIIFDRITDMLQNLFKENMQYHQIGICASTESIEKMHTNLYSSRGIHLFKNVYSISDYTKIDRISVLQNLFENEKLNYVNFEELSIKTEGFVMEDLVNFCHRAVHEASKNALSIDDPVIINNDHCENALKNTFVISLANVKLHSPGENDFSDIGGLQDIKKVLVENLMWPVQYPSIFSKAPLRQQSGLLLYGPPGTGKTLLAAAAAKQCGLRLISVKGPELLSKYIGASEKAVRDIFEKALSVRPCILFFDEFDSLAPRRGHDNTGVTDRVVNQLLTQLDGVESLTGVCVLAATSRPELLDPALLRPGRIDKQLLCPLPDQTSRLEILTVLSKKISLAPDVDLEFIAKETENFTGADLKSLTYSAQLSTIDYLLENNHKSDDTQSKVTHQHFLEALAKTKPSLSVHERLRYERIYAKFRTGSTIETGLRATMA